jgi:hypothetical protein
LARCERGSAEEEDEGRFGAESQHAPWKKSGDPHPPAQHVFHGPQDNSIRKKNETKLGTGLGRYRIGKCILKKGGGASRTLVHDEDRLPSLKNTLTSLEQQKRHRY